MWNLPSSVAILTNTLYYTFELLLNSTEKTVQENIVKTWILNIFSNLFHTERRMYPEVGPI